MKKNQLNIYVLLLLLLSLSLAESHAQQAPESGYKMIRQTSLVSNNFYFLSLLDNDTLRQKMLENDPVLSTLNKEKLAGISGSPANIEMLSELQFSTDEIDRIGKQLLKLYDTDPALKHILKNHIYPSGTYYLYNQLPEKDFLLKIWEQDAKGINRFIDVYGKGVKPKYAAIDSIDFQTNSKNYLSLLQLSMQYIRTACRDSRLFFAVPVQSFLTLADLNDRYEAIDYEPMEQTVNKKAYEAIGKTDFKKYPYSIILVLGAGPSREGVALDPVNKIRLREAVLKYKEGKAPFLVVSGGRVHPFKTKYSEAREMKRFLIEQCEIPEEAIIMEPHARHTTTNIRNTVRIMFRHGIPMEKAAIVSSDSHIDYIAKDKQAELFNKRCLEDMSIIPHKLGERIDATSVEFYPQIESLYINPNDPLDP